VIIKQGGATIIDRRPASNRSESRRLRDRAVGSEGGIATIDKKFTLTRGGRAVVKVWFDPRAKPPRRPGSSRWTRFDPRQSPNPNASTGAKELVGVIVNSGSAIGMR